MNNANTKSGFNMGKERYALLCCPSLFRAPLRHRRLCDQREITFYPPASARNHYFFCLSRSVITYLVLSFGKEEGPSFKFTKLVLIYFFSGCPPEGNRSLT
jgi:hypothetical protein